MDATPNRTAVPGYLLVAQFTLLGCLGMLVVLAPEPTILRAVWLAAIVTGAAAVIAGVSKYVRSRSKTWLWLSGISALGLVAALPVEPWALGW